MIFSRTKERFEGGECWTKLPDTEYSKEREVATSKSDDESELLDNGHNGLKTSIGPSRFKV